MRPTTRYRRRFNASFWLGGLLVILVAGGGLVALLTLMGVPLNPFAEPGEDPFMVRIPINSRAIPAYQRVEREDILHPQTGQLMVQRVPPRATIGMSIVGIAEDGQPVDSRVAAVLNEDDAVVFVDAEGHKIRHAQTLELGGALININRIIGRVVKKDKRAGMGFRESTFFPEGTPEGIAGATPSGMRAVVLDATKLNGIHALNAGDRVDLLASVPLSQVGSFPSQYNQRLPGASLVIDAGREAKGTDAPTQPMLLAQNALVLKPVYVRSETSATSTLTQGKRLQNVPKYEVAIAVNPDDVIPVQLAVNKSLNITCVAYSMQAGESEAAVARPASNQLMAPVTVRAVLAYDVMTRDVFVSPATRQLRLEPVSQQDVDTHGLVTSIEEALGGVARHDIPAGSFIRKQDLLLTRDQRRKVQADTDSLASALPDDPAMAPPARQRVADNQQVVAYKPVVQDPPTRPQVIGDRPAITRFLPEGMSVMALPWSKLYGAEQLQIDDRIDLFASYSLKREGKLTEQETRPDGTVIVREKWDSLSSQTLRTLEETFHGRGESWFVATDAIVIGPLGFPVPAAARRTLLEDRGGDEARSESSAGTGPALLLAVSDRDVERVAAALATQDVQFTIAMRGDDQPASVPPGKKRIVVAPQKANAFDVFNERTWSGNRARLISQLVDADDPRYQDAIEAAEITQFYGRVLRHTVYRDQPLTPSDFFPPGTQPGYSAAVPAGWSAVPLLPSDVENLDAFEEGDEVAILSRLTPESDSDVVRLQPLGSNVQGEVVVPQAQVLHTPSAGRPVLAVPNTHLARFQAELGRLSQSDQDRRSHLLAVVLHRDSARDAMATSDRRATGEHSEAAAASIRDYRSQDQRKRLEAWVGNERTVYEFSTPPAR